VRGHCRRGASKGVCALDKDRNVKWWHEASNVFCVEVLDLDADGKPEVVHIDGERIVIRDSVGKLIRQFPFRAFSLDHLVLRGQTDGPLVVGTKGRSLCLLDPLGNEVQRVKLPRSKGYTVNVQPVKSNDILYYAAANKVSYAYEIGYLHIFTEKGEIVHEEVFAQRIEALGLRLHAETRSRRRPLPAEPGHGGVVGADIDGMSRGVP